MDDPAAAAAQDLLTVEEIGRRASGGAALLVVRGGLVLALGLVANVILARLLEPRDFGIVALGTVLLTVGTFLADGGLGSGLIRRPEPPRRRELEAVNGVQVGATVALAACGAGAAAVVGGDAWVVALMVASLPIMILKVPSSILLERS